MTYDASFTLRYNEVALKGANRLWFEQKLATNAHKLIARELATEEPGDRPDFRVRRQYGRLLVEIPQNSSPQAVQKLERAQTTALNRLFGLSSFSPVRKVKSNLELLAQAAVEEFAAYQKTYGMPRSFRVQTVRTEKALPLTSPEIDRIIGGAIKDAYPTLAVDLKKPDFHLGLELRFHHSYLWTQKIPGPGGIPVGTNGPVLTLISGGLDSPVAAIQILRRGAPTSFVHFYGTPFVGEDVLQKIEDLVRIVNRFQPVPKPLYIVPFGKLQEKIALVTNPKMRTLLYRRMMVRIGCALAGRIKAKALVTGESLGQVASQTLENMGTINEVATLPILRPLLTYDKDEIIEEAVKRGTYDTSIRPGIDCCTLFADRHPVIRSNSQLIEEQEANFPIQEFMEEALSSVRRRDIE
jgi:thiamine biosynthesis protein ThiI